MNRQNKWQRNVNKIYCRTFGFGRMFEAVVTGASNQRVTPSRGRILDLSPKNRARNSMMPLAIVSKSLVFLARKSWRSSLRPWMKRSRCSPV
jgi:hypothetical protein